jgi:hypothetical protein
MADAHNKVMIIVEETVQHVYLLDPEARDTAEAHYALPRLLLGSIVEGLPSLHDRPPSLLGKRAAKGVPMPLLLQKHEEHIKFSRFSGLTMVLPDEDGKPAEEIKVNPKTITRKPVKA